MKKRIITSALALALAFSLCACIDNTSTMESYSDSTSGTVTSSETVSFAQSDESVLLPESLPETSKSNQADEDVEIINIYDYIPVGYVDEEQRYLLLKANADNSLNDYTCDYVVYDDREKKAVYCFTVGGYYDPVSESQPFDSDVKYSEGMFSFSAWNYYVDTDECERWYEVTDVYGNLIYKSTTSKTQISHCTYVPSDDKVYYNASVNDECCFYKMNSDGSNKDKLFNENFADFYVLDNEIVGYYCEGEAFTDEFDACYFCVMDKNGKMIQQINIGPFSNCNRRLVKAGDFICFMSPFDPEINPEFSERSNGVIFYNYKTNELRVQYFDNEIENSYCGITPNGKYLITCVPNDVEIKDSALYGYDRGDTTVNIYDTATGEKLKYEKLGKENLRPSYMNVFNDRVVFMDGWNKSVYMIDSI